MVVEGVENVVEVVVGGVEGEGGVGLGVEELVVWVRGVRDVVVNGLDSCLVDWGEGVEAEG